MADRTQIGPAIDADLWHEFRENVRARKGQVRGVLGDELETAIRQYLHDDTDPNVARVERKVDRIAEDLGVGLADGGADTRDTPAHTHAPSRLDVTEKPSANAATEKKVRYLANEVIEREVPNSREITDVPVSVLRDVVKDEYGFRSDTAKRYVAEIIDHFGLVDHPDADGILVTEERKAELIEQRKERLKAETEEKFE